MQIIKPSTQRLIWEFSGRDADFDTEFRAEQAAWMRHMRRVYGNRSVCEHFVRWAQERSLKRCIDSASEDEIEELFDERRIEVEIPIGWEKEAAAS